MMEHINSIMKKPSRVVILGAKGFVGNAVLEKLRELKISTLPLGRNEVDLLNDSSIDFLKKNINKDDCLLVISAEAPVKDNMMLERNIRMASNICNVVNEVKPEHIVYVSSDAVYKDSMKPLCEDSCAQPDSLHGVMHLTREVMFKNYYNGPLGIIRPTLIYGDKDPHNGYGPNRFRRLAESNQDIVLFGNGEEQRDHIYIGDVAELIVNTIMRKSYGILNAATGNIISFYEIAKKVVDLTKADIGIVTTERIGPMPHGGHRAFDPSNTYKSFPEFEYKGLDEGMILMSNKN